MDDRAETKIEDDMAQSWLELIDEEEDALLNEAVSHTIRQLSAEIKSSSTNSQESKKTANPISNYHEIVELEENCMRVNEETDNGAAASLPRKNGNCKGEGGTAKNEIETEGNSSPLFRKRPREDSLNTLPAKISRNRHNSSSSSSTNSSSTGKKKIEYETDPATLARRQKDIDYGKNTIGYDRYIQVIPKKDRTKEHPKTPPKYVKYSRRGWDGMVRLWRKQLHAWDPPEDTSSNIVDDKDRENE